MVYANIPLRAKDGVRTHAWLIRHPDTPQLRGPTIVFFQARQSHEPTAEFWGGAATLFCRPKLALPPPLCSAQENAGNIAHRLQNIGFFLRNVRCNVAILSYRGYGESEGSPSEAGIKQDAQARRPSSAAMFYSLALRRVLLS